VADAADQLPALGRRLQRWIAAGCFEAFVHDLRTLLRTPRQREVDAGG
jgi:hypothetical protein